MTGTLLYGYLGGWILSSIAIVAVAWRLKDKQEPAPHSVPLSILAGAVWPVLVIALAEAGFMALGQEVLHDKESPHSVAV